LALLAKHIQDVVQQIHEVQLGLKWLALQRQHARGQQLGNAALETTAMLHDPPSAILDAFARLTQAVQHLHECAFLLRGHRWHA
jgi:hypothetical protein